MTTELSTYLDFLIALIFTLAVGSMILSVLFELFAYYVKLRGKFLKKAIEEVLNDGDFNLNYAALFYEHPQIDLTKKNYRYLPFYISSLNFAQTLINTLVQTNETNNERFEIRDGESKLLGSDGNDTILPRFRQAVSVMQYSDLKVLLTGFINTADVKEDLAKNISLWYDEYMNRVSGWYKIRTQKIMFVMAVVGCFALNVDLFRIARTLIHDRELSAHIAGMAETYYEENKEKIEQITHHPDTVTEAQAKQYQQDLKNYLSLVDAMYKKNAPVGWQSEDVPKLSDDNSGGFWAWKFAGCLLAACALALGAPFWFDLLGKLVNLRKAGLKPLEVKKE